jgi:hypothetical protein
LEIADHRHTPGFSVSELGSLPTPSVSASRMAPLKRHTLIPPHA